MKKLLLTSAIVAVAGAAAAEITWSGEADLEWRGHTDAGDEIADDDNGIAFDVELDASGSAQLDNGITATIVYGLDLDYDIEEDGTADVVLDDFPTITFESSVATLTVGDVETSYVDTFGDDVYEEVDGELVATLDTTVSSFGLGVSYVIDGTYGDTDDDREQLPTDLYTVVLSGNVSGIKGAIGVAGVAGSDDDVLFGILGGYELNGIDIAAKYQTQGDELSIAELDLAYTMSNGVSLGAELTSTTYDDDDAIFGYEVYAGFEAMGADILVSYEDDDADDDEDGDFAIDAAYEVLPGLTVLGGVDFSEEATLVGSDEDAAGIYVATSYDLGGGASVYASYATYDEAGDEEYNNGATLGLSLSF